MTDYEILVEKKMYQSNWNQIYPFANKDMKEAVMDS